MKIKKIFLFIFFIIISLLMLTTKVNAESDVYLNNLDIKAQINKDGSMDVTETWNVEIYDTNTLYKTFKRDSSKYSSITNVVVTEVGGKELIPSNKWAYHMEKNYYYGGLNQDNNYEICWGVGLKNKNATKKYIISYRVTDAIAKYNDIAELYWQFIGSEFEVSAKKITGTIKLPEKVSSNDEIKVWGHVETLNGEIYAVSEDTVEFNLNDFRSGRYVEIRVAFPSEVVDYSGRMYYQNRLETIISEETVWANEANARRERQLRTEKMIKNGTIILGSIFSFLLILQLIKYFKKLGEIEKLRPIQEWDYFREIPGKNRTPGDAIFISNNGVVLNQGFGNIFSATLLNLSLKGYFKIETEKDLKDKEQVYISIQKDIDGLEYEEALISEFVKKSIGDKEKITIKEFQKYITKHPENVNKLIEKTLKEIKTKNEEKGFYDKKTATRKDMYIGIAILYFVLAFFVGMFTIAMSYTISIPATLAVCGGLIVNAILALCINGKLSRLTQEGINEKSEWKGLKKYMEDFSLLNEKEVPALTVWEGFLVYATVFGIADKVIKQLKIIYPEIENMDNFNRGSYVYLMSHTNFNSSFNKAINSSISSAMSSGSGGGGGFSGGGGFGRRPEVADGGR